MHIGFLTPEYVLSGKISGGLANYVQKTAYGLSALGHDITIFVLSERNHVSYDKNIKVIEIEKSNLKLTYLPRKIRWVFDTILPSINQILSSRRIALQVWRENSQHNFDILQSSSYMAPGYWLRNNGKIPLVCRISSYTPVVRSAYGRQRDFGEYLSDWLEIRQVLDADASFAPSKFTAFLFEQLEAFKTVVLRTPMDFIKVEPDDLLYKRELAGIRYLLFFGTLSKIKGVDLIADIIPAVIRIHPEIHFVFVGRDDGMNGGTTMMEYILMSNKWNLGSYQLYTHCPKVTIVFHYFKCNGCFDTIPRIIIQIPVSKLKCMAFLLSDSWSQPR